MNKDQIISKLIGNLFNTGTEGEHITVAELKTVEKNGLKETTDINTALVSASLIKKIKSSHINPYVNRSSVHYDNDYEYNPSFWLYLSKSSGLKKVEPLVVSWCSGNNTTFCIDQGFLSTYYLTPRLADGEINWDDLKKPNYEVVKNKLVSEYNFKHSEAFVKVKIDYLKDYLSLRKKNALKVITVKREILITNEIDLLLNDNKDYYIEEFKQYEIRIQRFEHKEGFAHLQIIGYQILFNENHINNEKEEIRTGHYWEGIEGLVTEWRARHEMLFQYAYVSDEVLAKYETDENYDVYHKTGSVNYRNQWGVNYCERIGKNAIKIEIKKLYEGNNFDIIDFWNKFSIHPSKIIKGENIALKAEKLTTKFFLFGRILSNSINKILGFNLTPSDIITLNEEHIEYTGWSNFFEYEQVAHHINLNTFSKEQFISRCKKLYILLGENLKEKTLRKIVESLEFPVSETKSFRSAKLLELIISYLITTNESGLDPANDKAIIVERVFETKDFNALTQLFALNNIRQIDAHKITGDSKSKLNKALLELGIKPNSIANNYSYACEQVYDSLSEMLNNINISLSK